MASSTNTETMHWTASITTTATATHLKNPAATTSTTFPTTTLLLSEIANSVPLQTPNQTQQSQKSMIDNHLKYPHFTDFGSL